MLVNRFLFWVEKIYNFFVNIGSNLQSIFLFYMRLTWGHQLLLAGLHKIQDIPGTAQAFAQLGIPAPLFHAYEVGFFETVGGLFFILGFASRIISIPIVFIMLTALSTAHADPLASFQFVLAPHKLVIQAPYPYLITSLLLLLFGPGRISLDAWLKRWIKNQPRY